MKLKRSTIAGLVLGVAFGLAAGAVAFTFIYAKGASYLTNDPKACANCHIMQEQLDGWVKSSHRNVATCNDCHTPHNFVGKYWTKGRNGFWHSYYFTMGNYPDPIQITDRSRKITERACRDCHADIVATIEGHDDDERNQTSCLRCHRNVGHLH